MLRTYVAVAIFGVFLVICGLLYCYRRRQLRRRRLRRLRRRRARAAAEASAVQIVVECGAVSGEGRRGGHGKARAEDGDEEEEWQWIGAYSGDQAFDDAGRARRDGRESDLWKWAESRGAVSMWSYAEVQQMLCAMPHTARRQLDHREYVWQVSGLDPDKVRHHRESPDQMSVLGRCVDALGYSGVVGTMVPASSSSSSDRELLEFFKVYRHHHCLHHTEGTFNADRTRLWGRWKSISPMAGRRQGLYHLVRIAPPSRNAVGAFLLRDLPTWMSPTVHDIILGYLP